MTEKLRVPSSVYISIFRLILFNTVYTLNTCLMLSILLLKTLHYYDHNQIVFHCARQINVLSIYLSIRKLFYISVLFSVLISFLSSCLFAFFVYFKFCRFFCFSSHSTSADISPFSSYKQRLIQLEREKERRKKDKWTQDLHILLYTTIFCSLSLFTQTHVQTFSDFFPRKRFLRFLEHIILLFQTILVNYCY